MYRSILVPLDGTAMAEHALLPAADIARRVHARLTLVVVHPVGPAEDAPRIGSAADEELRRQEEGYLEGLRASMASFGVAAEIELLRGGDVASRLTGYAREREVDLVIGATHGRGSVARLLLGSPAIRLAHELRCPMLLLKPYAVGAREPAADGPRRIAIALDGSARAERAIEAALALAPGAAIDCLLVRAIRVPVPASDVGAEHREAESYLSTVAERLEACGDIRVERQVRLTSDPARAILTAAARWRADLLALTTRERSTGARLLLGSVADDLVRTAAMPVLVCHAF